MYLNEYNNSHPKYIPNRVTDPRREFRFLKSAVFMVYNKHTYF